ncbi:hypothetical protein GCM10011514_48730 [Emticicia aquatilis]|uniref:Uncharacterized protein n=1 Tax=Emticicia aquatilis TaxID=1537369 RepID=A0A916Z6S3_9BACT|nr:hypothetical protein [Emticicia aquatilis]GGD78943.1 hypothetical protein GCM10011514_48730 [Emticicia aquatilis]
MANIKISKNEEKFIKAMDSIALKTTKNQEEISKAINSNFIKITENEGKFINAMNNHASSVSRLSAKYSDLFKTVDAVYKIINAEAGKIHTFNRTIKTLLEEWSKIDWVAITNNWNKILQQFIDDYNQFVESVEEDKWHDYYHLTKEHSTHVEKHLPYVTDDLKYFLKFYVPYNIRFLGLNKHNHREKKYKLHLFDLNLFHQYMNVLTNEGGSEEEALEIVWNNFDKRNTENVNIVQFQIRNDVFENKKENTVFGKIPNGKQKKVLKLIVDEMRKGTQKTDAINDSYRRAGYKTDRQVWTIVKKVEKGELVYNEFTELLKNK